MLATNPNETLAYVWLNVEAKLTNNPGDTLGSILAAGMLGAFGRKITTEVMPSAASKLRPPRIGPKWKARDILDPALRSGGCEKVAQQIKGHIGGDVHRITVN